MTMLVFWMIVHSSTAERKSRTNIVTKGNKFCLKHNALSEVRVAGIVNLFHLWYNMKKVISKRLFCTGQNSSLQERKKRKKEALGPIVLNGQGIEINATVIRNLSSRRQPVGL